LARSAWSNDLKARQNHWIWNINCRITNEVRTVSHTEISANAFSPRMITRWTDSDP
jgi:hypothetical protein